MDLGVARTTRRRPHDEAVSELVGTILLIGITVIMVTGLSVLIFSRAGPVDESHGTYASSVEPGADGLWATGDELIALDHMGGESLQRDATFILLQVAGVELRYSGATLRGGFEPDGYLKAGERWSLTRSIALSDTIRIEVVSEQNSGSNIAFSTSFTASCAGDAIAPRLATRTQSPPDLTTGSSGAVTVVFTIDDDCAGVNQNVNPTLYYRLYTGTAPSYTSAGAMTRTAANVWQGTIPDQAWSGQSGKTLEYYASGMTDTLGHARDSPVVVDLVESGVSYKYPSTNTAVIGTVGSFARMQAGPDALEASLSESSTLVGLAARNGAIGGTTLGVGWNAGNLASLSDNTYQTNADNAPGTAAYQLGDQWSQPGLITAVVLKAEVSILTYANDAFQFRACIESACNAYSGNVGGSASDVIATYDISCQRPGSVAGACGLWTWPDIEDLSFEINPIIVTTRDGTWRIDHAYAEVTYTPNPTNRLAVEVGFASVTAGTNYAVEVVYRATGDTFAMEAWDGFQWVQKGAPLSSGSSAYVKSTLTTTEYQAGSPKIRFVDLNVAVTPGTLYVDYVRVKSS